MRRFALLPEERVARDRDVSLGVLEKGTFLLLLDWLESLLNELVRLIINLGKRDGQVFVSIVIPEFIDQILKGVLLLIGQIMQRRAPAGVNAVTLNRYQHSLEPS